MKHHFETARNRRAEILATLATEDRPMSAAEMAQAVGRHVGALFYMDLVGLELTGQVMRTDKNQEISVALYRLTAPPEKTATT